MMRPSANTFSCSIRRWAWDLERWNTCAVRQSTLSEETLPLSGLVDTMEGHSDGAMISAVTVVCLTLVISPHMNGAVSRTANTKASSSLHTMSPICSRVIPMFIRLPR